MSKTVGIIGAGVAGLATAVRLAKKGHQITVFEKNAYPGGKLTSLKRNQFTFDAGPSLFTMPQYLSDILVACGKNPESDFPLHRLDPICHYFYPNGKRFSSLSNETDFINEAHRVFGEPKKKLRKVLSKSKFIYERTHFLFMENSLHKKSTYLNFNTLKSILSLPFLETGKTLASYYQQNLETKEMQQYFLRYATYNGSNPYLAPATLHIIPHLEHAFGAYLPANGMQQITDVLYQLAIENGVKFQFNTGISEIIHQGEQVKGVKTEKGEIWDFNRVVSNMDIHFTYKKLLPKLKAPERILGQPKSSSAFIFYWGIKREFKELGVHNIFFTTDYNNEFNTLFQDKSISQDPTIYINITSKLVKQAAPEGSENWFVMVNAPCNSGQNWEELRIKTRKNILSKLTQALGVNPEPYIVEEEFLDPPGIEQKTGSHLGSLYGYSSNTQMAAFFRHTNLPDSIKGLYFCGGSVHPGGGIPLCLMSAKIIDQYFK